MEYQFDEVAVYLVGVHTVTVTPEDRRTPSHVPFACC